MLDLVKMALRITTDAYDDELATLIKAAFLDLGLAGVDPFTETTADDLVKLAVMTYCKLNFGLPDDADRLKDAYDLQKAALSMATGYTTWDPNE
jgi:hypothetical protein